MHGKLYIENSFTSSVDEGTFEVVNPYTLEILGYQARATKDDIINAVTSSHNAFKSFAKTTAFERADYLRGLYDLMMTHERDIANIMTLEQGKPLKEAIGEVRYAASYVKWYAEEGIRIKGDILQTDHPKSRLQVLKEPIGPVALITPWNFPLAMFVRKLAPAIAAGCTVIVKPASQTPFSAVKFFELIDKLNMPSGVCQLLTGDSKVIGDILIEDPRIRKISFTGSTETGKMLASRSADTLKRLSLELGGHAPLIVFEDADIKKAVKGAMISKFRNGGQACIASNRIYVHENVKDQFIALLLEKVRQIKVGNGMDNVDIGPMIDEKSYKKMGLHVSDALSKGATLLLGGEGYRQNGERGGYLYPATVLDNVEDNMVIATEETFGPILPILSFKTDEEAIERANSTPYGLAAYAYTENITRATYAMENLDFGMIGLNSGILGSPNAPFGGIKMSGYGREGGKYGIEEYLHTKYINIGL